jgi:hypothetical protein
MTDGLSGSARGTGHVVVIDVADKHEVLVRKVAENRRKVAVSYAKERAAMKIYAPHVHSRRAKGSVRPCRNEMTLDVEDTMGRGDLAKQEFGLWRGCAEQA